jgi:hypothetical protein
MTQKQSIDGQRRRVDYPAPGHLSGDAAMADRSQSPAFAALSASGRKVLHAVEKQAGRGAVAITLDEFMEHTALCRSAVRHGIRQCELLSFVVVSTGHRRVNQFALAGGWRELDAGEAARLAKQVRLPTPPRASSAPPRAVRQVKRRAKVPVEVEQPPPPRQPSMPVVQWIGDGQ